LLKEGQVLLFGGRLSIREDDLPKLIAESVAILDPDARRLPEGFSFYTGGNHSASGGSARPAAAAEAIAPAAPLTAESAGRPTAGSSGKGTLLIRYYGRYNDPGYQRLLAMLQYFHGDAQVRIYLAQSERTVDLPPACWVELSNDVLKLLAGRYGARNLAII